MSYQLETALEAKLIKKLSANGYGPVKIASGGVSHWRP